MELEDIGDLKHKHTHIHRVPEIHQKTLKTALHDWCMENYDEEKCKSLNVSNFDEVMNSSNENVKMSKVYSNLLNLEKLVGAHSENNINMKMYVKGTKIYVDFDHTDKKYSYSNEIIFDKNKNKLYSTIEIDRSNAVGFEPQSPDSGSPSISFREDIDVLDNLTNQYNEIQRLKNEIIEINNSYNNIRTHFINFNYSFFIKNCIDNANSGNNFSSFFDQIAAGFIERETLNIPYISSNSTGLVRNELSKLVDKLRRRENQNMSPSYEYDKFYRYLTARGKLLRENCSVDGIRDLGRWLNSRCRERPSIENFENTISDILNFNHNKSSIFFQPYLYNNYFKNLGQINFVVDENIDQGINGSQILMPIENDFTILGYEINDFKNNLKLIFKNYINLFIDEKKYDIRNFNNSLNGYSDTSSVPDNDLYPTSDPHKKFFYSRLILPEIWCNLNLHYEGGFSPRFIPSNSLNQINNLLHENIANNDEAGANMGQTIYFYPKFYRNKQNNNNYLEIDNNSKQLIFNKDKFHPRFLDAYEHLKNITENDDLLFRRMRYQPHSPLNNLSKIILFLMITDDLDTINIPSNYGDRFFTFENIKFVSPFYGGNKNILRPNVDDIMPSDFDTVKNNLLEQKNRRIDEIILELKNEYPNLEDLINIDRTSNFPNEYENLEVKSNPKSIFNIELGENGFIFKNGYTLPYSTSDSELISSFKNNLESMNLREILEGNKNLKNEISDIGKVIDKEKISLPDNLTPTRNLENMERVDKMILRELIILFFYFIIGVCFGIYCIYFFFVLELK